MRTRTTLIGLAMLLAVGAPARAQGVLDCNSGQCREMSLPSLDAAEEHQMLDQEFMRENGDAARHLDGINPDALDRAAGAADDPN